MLRHNVLLQISFLIASEGAEFALERLLSSVGVLMQLQSSSPGKTLLTCCAKPLTRKENNLTKRHPTVKPKKETKCASVTTQRDHITLALVVSHKLISHYQ
jgi:hypothetical protein